MTELRLKPRRRRFYPSVITRFLDRQPSFDAVEIAGSFERMEDDARFQETSGRIDAMLAQAKSMMSDGDFAGALRLCREAEGLAAGREKPLADVRQCRERFVAERIAEGDSRARNDELVRAIEAWQEVVDTEPAAVVARRRLEAAEQLVIRLGPAGLKMKEADGLVRAAKPQEAITAFEEARQMGADSKTVAARISGLRCGGTQIEMARVALGQGRLQEALASLDQAEQVGAARDLLTAIRTEMAQMVIQWARAAAAAGQLHEISRWLTFARQLGVADDAVSAVAESLSHPALAIARKALATGNLTVASDALAQAELLGADPAVVRPMREQFLLAQRQLAASKARRHR